jgi:amino acid permease
MKYILIRLLFSVIVTLVFLILDYLKDEELMDFESFLLYILLCFVILCLAEHIGHIPNLDNIFE